MASPELPDPLWSPLIEELASRVADQLAPQLAKMVSESHGPGPWLTTAEAIKYTGLPDGTFRKLPPAGRFPPVEVAPRSFSAPRSTRRSCRRPVSPKTLAS
jgi:hypothetical protein